MNPKLKKNLDTEKRKLHRINQFVSDEFTAILCFPNEEIKCRILNFHFEGAKLKLPRTLPSGAPVKIVIIYGKKIISEIAAPKIVSKGEDFVSLNFSYHGAHASRTATRHLVSPNLKPTLLAQDPIKLGSILHLQVLNFSSKGMRLETSLTNKHLLKDMIFKDASLVLPGIEIISVNFVVKHIATQTNKIQIGAEFKDINEKHLQALAQFAVFGTVTSSDGISDSDYLEIKKGIFSLKQLGSTLRIENLSSPEDYYSVLKIRFTAYKEAGIVKDGVTVDDMADEYDARSIIVVAKFANRVVGTVRLIKCEQKSDKFLFEKDISYGSLDGVADRNNYVEISRLAIDPVFQGTDIVVRLIKELARQIVLNDKYALCLARKSQRKSYYRAGFKKVSDEIPHPMLKDETLAVLAVDGKDFARGKGMSILAWEYMAEDVAQNLDFANVFKKPKKKFSHFFLKNIELLILKLKKKRK